MSTKALWKALETAFDHPNADGDTCRAARAELEATEKAQDLLRGMFKDRQLDPYPTSDGSPEYVLARWCEYVTDED